MKGYVLVRVAGFATLKLPIIPRVTTFSLFVTKVLIIVVSIHENLFDLNSYFTKRVFSKGAKTSPGRLYTLHPFLCIQPREGGRAGQIHPGGYDFLAISGSILPNYTPEEQL
jgi:hypothetical protein